MANLHRINIRRGVHNKLITDNENLSYGQQVYDATDNTITVGGSTEKKFKEQKPITVREVNGYHGEEEHPLTSRSGKAHYYFGSKKETGVDYLIIDEEGQIPIVIRNANGKITILNADGDTVMEANKTLFSNKLSAVGGATNVLQVLSKFGVTGAAEFSSTVDIKGNSTLEGTLQVDGSTTLNETLTVADGKATTLGGTLKAKQGATLDSTLSVGGKATFNDDVDVNENLKVADGKTTTLGGATTVKGASTFKGTITAEEDVSAEKKVVVGTTDKTTIEDDTVETGTLRVSQVILRTL